MKVFEKELRKNPFLRVCGGFFYKLTRNPNLTTFFGGGGGWGLGKGSGEGKCTCMSCLYWQFYSSRRTPVQNHFENHAYM